MEELKRTINGETMEERTLPKLLMSRKEAEKKIQERIKEGQKFRDQPIDSEDEYESVGKEAVNWSIYNKDLLVKLFESSALAEDYKNYIYEDLDHDDFDSHLIMNYVRDYEGYVKYKIDKYRKNLTASLNSLEGIRDRLELFEEPDPPTRIFGDKIFIGHGHSPVWRELKDFISERLELPYDEFNRVPTSGSNTLGRIKEMLDQACMAFLIMTAEDEQPDGTQRARENVVHEAGLFQSRLGFKKAIILLEEGCEEFSNIRGLNQIRFPKGNIEAVFEKIRQVLEREKII